MNGKHLLASWGKEKERKNTSEGKKKRKEIRAFATTETQTLALHAFQLSNTVYQRIELT